MKKGIKMNIDKKILEIEIERLEMEKARDKQAKVRFIIGGIIIAFATSGLSLYLDHQQSERAFAISEKQMIIPMIYNNDPLDFDGRLAKIQDFLDRKDLYESNLHFLEGQKKVILEQKESYIKLEKERLALEKQAEEEKKRAKSLANEEAKRLANQAASKAELKANAIKLRQSAMFRSFDRNEHGVLY